MTFKGLVDRGVEATNVSCRVGQIIGESYSPGARNRRSIAAMDVRESWQAVASTAEKRALRAQRIVQVAQHLQARWEDVARRARLASGVAEKTDAAQEASSVAALAESATIGLSPRLRRSIFR